MSGRVVAARRRAKRAVDLEVHRVADGQRALPDLAEVRDHAGDRLVRAGDLEAHGLGAAPLDGAAVTDLSAGLAVERRDVGDEERLVALHGTDDEPALPHDGDDAAFRLLALVTEEPHPVARPSAHGIAHLAPHLLDRLIAELGPLAARALLLEGLVVA